MIKVCNLYPGAGGNRKLWKDVKVVAVENNPKIAGIYMDFFPQDKMIIGDAHQYLLEHFEEYDFIWSSPPCPSHSHIRKELAVEAKGQNKPIYPDMKLYEEILLLKGYFKGKWCVENVIGWYKPLIPPQERDNHYFWTNFHIGYFPQGSREHHGGIEDLMRVKGFDLTDYKGVDKRRILRNCVNPYLGLHILNESKRDMQGDLFK